MKRLLLVIVIVLSVMLSAQTKSEQNGYIKLFFDGKYREAIGALTKIEPLKRSAEEWYYLAQSYNSVKELENAIESFEAAVKLDSMNSGYRLNFSKALNVYGNTEGAIENLIKIAERDPSNSAALFDLGTIYQNQKKHLLAKSCFEKLVVINKWDFLSHYYLALSTFNCNPAIPDSTIIPHHLFQCMFNNPRFAPAYELLGTYHMVRKEYNKASVYFNSMNLYSPTNPEAFFKTGLAYEKSKKHKNAIECYLKAVKLDSTSANYWSHLGFCYYVTGTFDSTVIAYKMAGKLNEDDPTVFQNLGMGYLKMDSLSAARNSFEIALANFGILQMVYILNQIGYIDLVQKNYESSQEYIEKVLALEPENKVALYNYARIFDEQKKYSQALKQYKKVLPFIKDYENMAKEFEFTKTRIKQIEKSI